MKNRSSEISAALHVSSEHAPVAAAWAQFQELSQSDSPGAPRFRPTLIIPGYRLLSEIHRGGQGVVYQAIQESTRKKVAIKVLKEGPLADTREFARFDREVDILSRINHPHIVAIHERGVAAGHAYYTMDYIAGQPLDAYVASAGLGIEEILHLSIKLCDAVNVAHLHGVIHRDLKPANIRIDEQGEPKVLDFGLAKLVRGPAENSSATGVTIAGQFVGSLPWASPEQAGGKADELDIRTDVYSLGVILYQLLTGRFPYPVTGRLDETIRHIMQTSPASASTARRRIDRDLDLIVLKCLAKEPEQRYQSAGDLARDVRHFLADEPVSATSPSSAYRLRKFMRRNRGKVVAAAAVAAVLMLGIIGTSLGLVWAIREQQRTEEQKTLAQKNAITANNETARADREARQAREVADFQSQLLANIDPQTMGIKLRANLLAKARAAASSGHTPEEIDARVQNLENSIAGIDLTGIALTALDENVFNPALAAIECQFAEQPLVKARLLQTMANTLFSVGHFQAATEPQLKALEIRRRLLGEEHPDTILSIGNMGVILKAGGNLASAEPFLCNVLEKHRRLLGSDNIDTLKSLIEMGELFLEQGKLAEAESCCREALQTCRRVLGDDHRQTLRAIHCMGSLSARQGKNSDAETYYREALETRRRTLGDEHRDTLNSINDLGIFLKQQGKLTEAEPLLLESMSTSRRVSGDEHPETLSAILNIGSLIHAQGRLFEAESYYKEALHNLRRVLGSEHRLTLVAISSMGNVLMDQGKLFEAKSCFQEALDTRRRLLGNEHQDTLNSINNMGMVLRAQGKLAEAESNYRESLDTRRRTLGDDHPDTLGSINNLAGLLYQEGKLSDAEALYREAMEKRRTLSEDHPHTINSINNLGVVLQAEGKLAEAEPFIREALEKRRRVLGDDHHDTVGAINNLAVLLKAQGKFSEAEHYYREALEKFRRLLGEDNPNTIITVINLGMLLEAQGHVAEAEPYLRDALEKRRRILGEDHPETLLLLAKLGETLRVLGEHADAVALLAPAESAVRREATTGNTGLLRRLLTALGRARVASAEFEAAEANLIEAHEILSQKAGAMASDGTDVLTGLVDLYEAWHAAEPDKGYETEAAEWRAQLQATRAATQPTSTK